MVTTNVPGMTRLTLDQLRERTLWRQFPDLPGRDGAAVTALVDRLGPIQSQVPRSPFLTASSRLPGVRYGVVQDLFKSFALLKTSSLRGTVHTSGRRLFPWLDAVARQGRAGPLRSQLGLSAIRAAEVVAEIEAYADGEWRTRDAIVAHLREWLAERESPASAAAVTGTLRESLLWGHSGLLRRPRDEHWEKRTDLYHRRARAVVPELGTTGVAESLTALVRVYLGALGPATRHDVAYFFGTGLTAADATVTSLGDEVVRLSGPDGETYLDLAEPPAAQPRTLGVRLLPEFDRDKAYVDLVRLVREGSFEKKSPEERTAIYAALGATALPGALSMLLQVLAIKPTLLNKKKVIEDKLLAVAGLAGACSIPAYKALQGVVEDKSQPVEVLTAARKAMYQTKKTLFGESASEEA